ncbi:MAG: AtpZ/AtpI family protein [Rhizobiaceae bacterium]
MAKPTRPNRSGSSGPGGSTGSDASDEDLERRRKQLGATLATRLPDRQQGKEVTGNGGASGYGQALKLSSEFVAGIAVGVGIGWIVDRFAGTSPWGLILFLLLGFAAGVLNVLRSVGAVSGAGIRPPETPDRTDKT